MLSSGGFPRRRMPITTAWGGTRPLEFKWLPEDLHSRSVTDSKRDNEAAARDNEQASARGAGPAGSESRDDK
jgi:hypothetical protein